MEFSLKTFNIDCLPNLKKLKLERPLIVFDTETTGLKIEIAEIIELMAIKIFPDGTFKEYYSLFNPRGGVSPGASNVHGYTKAKLIKEPRMMDKIDEIFEFFIDCDLSAYNGLRFDIPLLKEEFKRHNKPYDPSKYNIIDPYTIMVKKEPSYNGGKRISQKLGDVYRRFFQEELVNSHTATADVIASIRVFDKQIELFKLPNSISEISNIGSKQKVILGENKKVEAQETKKVNNNSNKDTREKKTEVRSNDGFLILDLPGKLFKANEKDKQYYFNKGKHNNEKIESKHLGYLKWVAEISDFDNVTKGFAEKLRKKLVK